MFESEQEIRDFVIKVIVALGEKQGASFTAIANQLAQDLKTNLNRAMRLAMRVNNAHNLRVY